MSQVDWSKAPEGATHWEPEQHGYAKSWMKFDGTNWYWWCASSEWIKADVSRERLNGMIQKPLEWPGTGLPPVGTVCMVYAHNTLWGMQSTSGHEREILAYHGDFVWLGYAGAPLETTRVDKVDFKPIRTPEQIAAEEREKAIQEMCELGVDAGDHTIYLTVSALYDAGWRKADAP